MTERLSLRRRLNPAHDRRKPSPSTSRGRSKSRRIVSEINTSTTKLPVKSLTRCASAPALFIRVSEKDELEEEEVREVDRDEGVLTRGKTCGDVLSTSAPSSNLAQRLQIYEQESCVYDKEAKVVVNVTVEGSVGPVRVMVRLGSSVEEMIHLIIQKYDREGRRHKLGTVNDVQFELHDSYFSLQCLDKLDLIGDVGSRTFYLRTNKKVTTIIPCSTTQSASCLTIPEAVSARNVFHQTLRPALLFLPGFISWRISKLMRRSRTFWKILGCLQSG